MGINKIMTLTPHGPHIRKCEATGPHSCLSQGTYSVSRNLAWTIAYVLQWFERESM